MTKKLIVFEGIDGSGKTTQAKMLTNKFINMGYDAIFTFEPTNGEYGQKLRKSFSSKRLTPKEEFNLFLKDRKEHIEKEIRPCLENGKIVIIDRYIYSSIAYQGALGIDLNYIKKYHESFIIEPDLVFIFSSNVIDCLNRIKRDRGFTDEVEKKDYLSKVEDIFRSLKSENIYHIDSSKSIENIHNEILRLCNKIL